MNAEQHHVGDGVNVHTVEAVALCTYKDVLETSEQHLQYHLILQQNVYLKYMLSRMNQESVKLVQDFFAISQFAITQAKHIQERDEKIADLEKELDKKEQRLSAQVESGQRKKRKLTMLQLDAEYYKSELEGTNKQIKEVAANLQSMSEKMDFACGNLSW